MNSLILFAALAFTLPEASLPAQKYAVPERAGRTATPKVEAVVDRGLMLELSIRCGQASGLITYSKIEKTFCTPKLVCHKSLGHAARNFCGRRDRPAFLK